MASERVADGGVDPCRCPLCGTDNACALTRGCAETACWCAGEVFPADLLARIPAAARGRACVCQGCVRGARGAHTTPSPRTPVT